MPPHWTLKERVNGVVIDGRRVSGNLPAATAVLALLDDGGGEGRSRKRGSKEKLRGHCRSQTTEAGDGAGVSQVLRQDGSRGTRGGSRSYIPPTYPGDLVTPDESDESAGVSRTEDGQPRECYNVPESRMALPPSTSITRPRCNHKSNPIRPPSPTIRGLGRPGGAVPDQAQAAAGESGRPCGSAVAARRRSPLLPPSLPHRTNIPRGHPLHHCWRRADKCDEVSEHGASLPPRPGMTPVQDATPVLAPSPRRARALPFLDIKERRLRDFAQSLARTWLFPCADTTNPVQPQWHRAETR